MRWFPDSTVCKSCIVIFTSNVRRYHIVLIFFKYLHCYFRFFFGVWNIIVSYLSSRQHFSLGSVRATIVFGMGTYDSINPKTFVIRYREVLFLYSSLPLNSHGRLELPGNFLHSSYITSKSLYASFKRNTKVYFIN